MLCGPECRYWCRMQDDEYAPNRAVDGSSNLCDNALHCTLQQAALLNEEMQLAL